MSHRTHQHEPQPSPTPVIADRDVTVPELLARAHDDYAEAQGRRDQLDHEDRVHGNQPAGGDR